MDHAQNFDFPETKQSEMHRNFREFMTYVARRLIDKILILTLSAGGVFLALSLYSYEPSDISLNSIPTYPQSYNWMGIAGAYSADLMLQLWGYASYLWVVFLTLWACIKYEQQKHPAFALKHMQMRQSIFFALLSVTVASGFMAILMGSAFLPTGSGGVFGLFISQIAQTGIIPLDITQCALSLMMALFFMQLAIGKEHNLLRLLSVPLMLSWHIPSYLFSKKRKNPPPSADHVVIKRDNPHARQAHDGTELLDLQRIIAESPDLSAEFAENITRDDALSDPNDIELSFMAPQAQPQAQPADEDGDEYEEYDEYEEEYDADEDDYQPAPLQDIAVQQDEETIDWGALLSETEEEEYEAEYETDAYDADDDDADDDDADDDDDDADDDDAVEYASDNKNIYALGGNGAYSSDDDDDAYEADDDADIYDEYDDEDEIASQPVAYQREVRNLTPEQLADKARHNFALPSINLLEPLDSEATSISDADIEKTAEKLEQLLHSFKIKGAINGAQSGPIITMYEFEPAPGVKTSQVVALTDDVARAMSVDSVRIAPVSGKSVIGIELPNPKASIVSLRDILSARAFGQHNGKLPIILGKNIGGKDMVVDLAKMPHLLIAGTTGSGKSVGVNAMILSLLYRYRPDQCRLIMIDPKMLELSVYNDIPHLLTPVVTDPKRAIVALKWAIREMERRYQLMSECNARNIINYNSKLDKDTAEPLPYIAIIIDEMADLMLVAGKEIEVLLQRLAQMARAAGIHLITATQRPSVDVLTGVIKANFPSRISYQVTSKFDSRTILGDGGAENLLGQGDMLFLPGGGKMQRIHGPFVTDEDVENVCDFLRNQMPTEYINGLTEEQPQDFVIDKGNKDQLYDQAVALVMREQKASTSYIQRQLQIGYNRAARLIEQMEAEGILSEANSAGKRQILIDHAA